MRIADLGTGSGAILLALLSELPNAHGFGTDISPAALQTAETNAADRQGSLIGRRSSPAITRPALTGSFDLIVSNPPYIRSADIAGLAIDVREYDPLAALDGGADGLDAYRALIPQAARLLAPGARSGRGGRARAKAGKSEALMAAAGLIPAGAPKADLAGIPRAVAGRKMPR